MLGHIVRLIHHYGLLGMFVSVAVENMGIPLPTEPAYIVGQSFIVRGEYPLWAVHLVLYLGHMFGAMISYYAGLRIAKGLMKKKEYTATQHKIAGWYEKHGAITVFGTRLIGYVRPWSSYVAGIAEVSFWPFFIYTSLGTIILNAVCLVFTATFLHIWKVYPFLRFFIVLSLAAGFGYVLYEALKKRSKKPEPSRK